MDKHAEHFVETFVKELEEENVAIFAGAGLSVGAGYVDWKKLLQPIAADLELDIDQEHDLISIAQYHLNEKQNRSGLNRVHIEQLSPGHAPTDIDRVLRKHAKAIGLDRGYSAHSMRATFITTALENGCSLEDVQRAAGHREPSTTKLYDRRGYIPEKSASYFATY